MQLQVNEKGIITGYALLGGFPKGIETEKLPEGFEENFCIGRYVYEDGMIREVPGFVPPESIVEDAEVPSLEERIADLEEAMAALAFGGEV